MTISTINLKDILSPISDNLLEFDNQISQSFFPQNCLINEISSYVANSGGKRLRPALVFLFSKMIGETKKEHHFLAMAVELIHNATLVHDDIIDNADKRRNNPTVHSKWNAKTAVLAGDYLLANALEQLILTQNNDVLTLFAKITKEICQGEVEQFISQNLLSVEEYIERIKRKTGMLFILCTKGACLISGEKRLEEATEFATNIGIAFQIIDDLLLFKNDYDEKTLTTDFDNAIFTLPLIFAAQDGLNINFEGNFKEFKNQIVETKAIDKSYELALEYTHKALENLSTFEDNQYKKSLCDLTKYIVDREF